MDTQLAILNSSYEPNWFLSTVAQSTAALIAIIGGFLISRLISLASRRSEAIDRLDNLQNRSRVVESELHTIDEDIEVTIHKWFLSRHLETMSIYKGEVDLEEIAENSNFIGSDPDEMAIFAKWVAETVKKAYQDIQNRFPNEFPPTQAKDLLTAGLMFEREIESRIYEQVAIDLKESRKTPLEKISSSYRANALIGLSKRSDRIVKLQDERVARRNELSYNLKFLEDEIEFLDLQGHFGNSSKMLGYGFLTLSYFGSAGIIFPLYLMTKNPVLVHAPMRMAVFVGFISGFFALLVFILNAVRNLNTV